MTLAAPPSNSVWYITPAISKQTENELLVLKRAEAEKEKGKDGGGGGGDDDDDNEVLDQATFGLQPAAHCGFQHLFIYLFWEANAGFMPVISYVYTHELVF